MALLNAVDSSTQELLDAQTHIWNHIFNFINSMALKCAIQLGIPDVIHMHGKPMTLCELADALAINKVKSNGLHRLMRLLVHSKFFEKVLISKDDEEKVHYWLTPASRLLLRDASLTLAPLVLFELDPIMIKACYHMREWLTNEDHIAPFETAHSESFWEKLGHEPRLSSLFHDAMASDSRLVTGALVRDCKHVFEGIESLVDVGGGTGTTAMAIADAFPNMKCIVLDLPHVVEGLKGSDNLTYIGGDMFETIPHSNAILFKWVLHNWDDEACVKILKKCKDAITSKDDGGKVMIIDMVVGIDEQGNDTNTIMEDQLFLDIAMMVYVNGKERSEKEWKTLFIKAGFTSYKITHAFGVRSLIEVYPN